MIFVFLTRTVQLFSFHMMKYWENLNEIHLQVEFKEFWFIPSTSITEVTFVKITLGKLRLKGKYVQYGYYWFRDKLEYVQDSVQWTVKHVQNGFYMSQVQLLRCISLDGCVELLEGINIWMSTQNEIYQLLFLKIKS